MNLIYLSPVPWTSFAQRSQKFVSWFQKQTSGTIIWIDPYPTRLPQWSDLHRKSDQNVSPTPHSEKFQLLRPRALPIEPIPCLGALNSFFWNDIFQGVKTLTTAGPTILGIGKPSELAIQLLKRCKFEHSFYDAMDDFPAFYEGLSRVAMARRENHIASQVSELLVSSTELKSRWLGKNHLRLTLNACDSETLPAIPTLTSRPPVLGYVGTIGRWFDWEMTIAIAEANPTLHVSLIGPVFYPPPRDLPPNIAIKPALPHAQAMSALKEFGAGLIPFKKTQLTKSVDPIKYYEYRAMGLPVISSNFGEMRFRKNEEGVFLLEEEAAPGQIEDIVKTALTYNPSVDTIDRFRRENSWEARFGAIKIFS